MPLTFPATLPMPHRAFISRMLDVISQDLRFIGVAAAGSFLSNSMDEFSDLDLIVAVAPGRETEVMRARHTIAKSFGNLLDAFTGEHVGEPRLLICLYGDPLLHVDLKFVSKADLHIRVEEPIVLWERDGAMTAELSQGIGRFPEPDIEWIESRFWIWIHYGAGKIGRGEIFEAIDFISFLRSTVLGPLALHRAGARPQGVRKLEVCAPLFSASLQLTIPEYDASDCLRALKACSTLYRELRDSMSWATKNKIAEAAADAYVEEIGNRIRGINAFCNPII